MKKPLTAFYSYLLHAWYCLVFSCLFLFIYLLIVFLLWFIDPPQPPLRTPAVHSPGLRLPVVVLVLLLAGIGHAHLAVTGHHMIVTEEAVADMTHTFLSLLSISWYKTSVHFSVSPFWFFALHVRLFCLLKTMLIWTVKVLHCTSRFPSFVFCNHCQSNFRMILKWKCANQTETPNGRKESDLIGLSNGRKRAWHLVS